MPHLSACLPVPSERQTGYAQGRQVIPRIDAGIAKKGRLWMDTNLRKCVRALEKVSGDIPDIRVSEALPETGEQKIGSYLETHRTE